jgi:hypothetical protein
MYNFTFSRWRILQAEPLIPKISHILKILKVHVFRHLFVCFQNSVYTLGEFHKNRNNCTVFEELSLSIVELTVANIRETAFATVKSITDTSNSSNSVLLFLNSKTQYNFNTISIHIQKMKRIMNNTNWPSQNSVSILSED